MPNSQFEQWRAFYQLEAEDLKEKIKQQTEEIEAARAAQNG